MCRSIASRSTPSINRICSSSCSREKRRNKKKVAPEAASDADSDTAGADDGTKEPAIDPGRDESLNILADLVDLTRGPTTASTTTKPAP